MAQGPNTNVSSDLVCNVVMPVFNRPQCTMQAILALHKSARDIPFAITVVDNGSEPELVARLMESHQAGIIDHLFLLPQNMGVACAANVGWELVPAPVCMKLDNDTALRHPHWLRQLLALWACGKPQSNLGGAFNLSMLRKTPGAQETAHGPLGLCATNLPGQAVLIPRAVSDILGFWNEEYGLYGGEDGDYGLRMQCAGFPQYYYLGPDYFENLEEQDDAQATYAARGIDKRRLHRELVLRDNLHMGRLFLNKILYTSGLRALKPLRRYAVDDVDGCRVRLRERQEYREFHRDLVHLTARLNKDFKEHLLSFRPDAPTAAALADCLHRHGQARQA